MRNKNNVAIMSVLIALVALLILIFSLTFILMNNSATKAKVENIIEPLQSSGTTYNQPNINIYDNNKDDEDEDPVIHGLPDMTLNFGQSTTLDLDNYASDDEDSHSELDFTIIYTSSATPAQLNLSINSSTHILTITEANGAWEGTQTITIKVKDTDGNTDSDTFIVTINNGSLPGQSSPVISGLPDIEFDENGSDNSLDLDDYVTDADNTDAEMTWTYTGNTNVLISIDSDNVVTFTATPDWNGQEDITFRVTDPDGNFDEQTIEVEVNPVSTPTVWQTLSDQTIDEDSASGTVVYANVASKVNSANINVASSNTHFTVEMSGNDLILTNIDANWYGFEIITLEADGETASFTLNVNQLFDDSVTICSFGKCYTYWN